MPQLSMVATLGATTKIMLPTSFRSSLSLWSEILSGYTSCLAGDVCKINKIVDLSSAAGERLEGRCGDEKLFAVDLVSATYLEQFSTIVAMSNL